MVQPISPARPAQPLKPIGIATIVFGALSVLGAMILFVLLLTTRAPGPYLLADLLVLVGIIGAIASAKSSRAKTVAYCAAQAVGLAPFVAITASPSYYFYFPKIIFHFGTLAIFAGAIGVIVSSARARAAVAHVVAAAPPRPAGYTADGRAFYPVVGYTTDGTPITADRVAPGFQRPSSGTNGMAIAAFILAFVFVPLAIPFGHIARSQCRKTGEQGGGLALAGLIIGYIWLAIVVVGLLVLVGGRY